MQTGMQLVKNRMNRKPRPCDSRAQPRVNNAHSEQYCDSVDSICHKNRFEILFMEDGVSDKCNPSVRVTVTVNITSVILYQKQKQTVNKGKNTVNLFTEGAMPDPLHENLNQKFRIMMVRTALNHYLLQSKLWLARISTSVSWGTL